MAWWIGPGIGASRPEVVHALTRNHHIFLDMGKVEGLNSAGGKMLPARDRSQVLCCSWMGL